MASNSTLAYEQIKEMIFHMELLPGARIPEVQIAEKLSLSRTPIHDALRHLAAEGLVTISHNRGASVVCFSEEEIKELGTIRMVQDILCAQLASYYGNAAQFEQLEALATLCTQAAEKGDIYGRIKCDMDFHLAIAHLSGNNRLIQQQSAIYQQIFLIQISQYTDIAHSLLQIHHHQPLIDAIRQGDLTQVRHLICDHVQHFYRIDPFLLQNYAPTVQPQPPQMTPILKDTV